ncbi:MAG: PKD domain-containing protein [Candidatus Hydrogenedentes bacterium]|nr:PKD domain-containing protein [Candidatus Hydrogenedentota bacterium]
MLRPLKFLTWPTMLGFALILGMGCPPAPSYLPAYIISPKTLDFGSETDTLQFTVAKNYTSQALPEFTLSTGGDEWIEVNPGSGNSSGPGDKEVITVTINRSRMAAGSNAGAVTVSAPGVANQEVIVTADASLVAEFSASPVLASVNENVQFTDESTIAPGSGPIVSWIWTFGDGKQSTQQNPTHKYKDPGTYSVTLTVQTSTQSDTQVKQNFIVVEDAGDIDADFIASTTNPPANTPVEFTDLSDPGTGDIDQWFWNFGDGGTSTDQNPSHTYTTVNEFTVVLTITMEDGVSDTETKNDYIDVQPVGPTANFIADDRQPIVGQLVQFNDLSDPGTSPILNWIWTFGDGGSSTAQSPIHIYNAAGAYTIYLSVTTAVGTDSETRTNYIVVSPSR